MNARPPFDNELLMIADYVENYYVESELAFSTARYCLMDALGCAILALNYPECKKLLGPVVPGTIVPNGARVPGTNFELDPIRAAFNIGTLIRWLDFNDTWLAAEWGHPSDNLGAILSVADYLNRTGHSITMKDVLIAMIKAYEIQGVLALENSFNRVGLDHVVLVKVASAAVVSFLLGGKKEEIANTLSHAWIDGQSLRTYRHAPNTGPRKSWAAGDATSRAVQLAWFIMQGEMGYPSALTAKKWGFYDVLFGGNNFSLTRSFESYVIENILFKISYPAEFHAQTAVEAAVILHEQIKNKFNQIEKIILTTHESAIRIISKTGPLHNPADRDHCLQYMVAVALLRGDLKADDYENKNAADSAIDFLREKMIVEEDKSFSRDYLDSNKRSITNAIQIYFKDGSCTDKIMVEYPLGHARRRNEAIPLLKNKFEKNMSTFFSSDKIEKFISLFADLNQLEKMPVKDFMQLFI